MEDAASTIDTTEKSVDFVVGTSRVFDCFVPRTACVCVHRQLFIKSQPGFGMPFLAVSAQPR
ncbi:hypothetical protein C0Q70_11873 [Pomacea canaliculata]|uniref:Uncharacterized protein n=1 Tax=Pomacea canaliculata TaxID=400727 RepID=A0A2T7P7A7_POMCA|nr:hypothetical protein C0Q70_11873 [Pomacea canaliculata]